MSKLYPPIIAGTIPAFCESILKVPFQMNRAVSKNEVIGFYLKIKTVQNSRLIGTASTDLNNIDFNNFIVNFDLSSMINKQDLNIGQYYKIQIAYVNKLGEVGHYSTVGVVKYTNKPKVEIQNLDKKNPNAHQYSYLGFYAQEGPDKDLGEKLYSYMFNIYDAHKKLLYSSDWQLHNTAQDIIPGESTCTFVLNKDLEENQKYYIEFEILTNNELHQKSGKYSLTQKKSVSPNVDFDLMANAEEEIENGGIVVGIRDNKEQGNQKNKILRTGSFKLIRADEESNFSEWNEILSFKLFDQPASNKLFVDYTVKHGIKYKYAIIQYNGYGLQSNKIESDIVSSDFEHIFLFDGERQLKIKYNPKISSFKDVLLESKIETLGNKYPFIFRNGNVEYKEFPLSGLISCLMDENYLFYPERKKEKPLNERVYDFIYSEVQVDNKIKYYYYPKDWHQLYVKEKLTDAWLTVRSYCKFKGIDIEEGYNANLYYGRKVIEEDKQGNKIEKIKYLSEFTNPQEGVSNERIYYFPESTSKLYVAHGEEYIKIDSTATYQPGVKYYLMRTQTKNDREITNYSFINSYSAEAIQNERDFKLEVLDWLNNGKPKLFRSPVEGNYIVRLMNSSLSPNDQLGRVLHNFNSTAYEVAECNFNNLKANNFIVTNNLTVKTIRWDTIKLDKTGIGSEQNLLKYKAIALRLEGLIPGDKIYINDGIKRSGKMGYTLVIGITGSYNIDLEAGMEITQIKFEGSPDNINDADGYVRHQGQLTYAYESAAFSSFDTIETFKLESTPIHQFFGHYDNVLNEINDIKKQLQQVYFIHAILRDEIEVYAQPQFKTELNEEGQEIQILDYYTYSRDKEGKYPIVLDDRYYIYKIHDPLIEGYRFYDGYHFKELELYENQILNGDKIWINDETEIQVFSTNDFFLKETEGIKKIETGYRILLEVCYQSTITNYGAEKEITYIADLLSAYEKAEENYKKLLALDSVTRKDIYDAEMDMKEKYKIFIQELELELERQGGIEGELV